ncbi:hypothetical protein GUJ93_ZPchr0010g10318 [Zizania palustris]|uniref:Uncharacterized protein n=1 Tax=Zizania palustris TaxID=103762 RepID=A0A8J5TM99_ZIZPA|nr:hypothetical protein GUJ93_ZPchr0010g10318 [Zizania palustris]
MASYPGSWILTPGLSFPATFAAIVFLLQGDHSVEHTSSPETNSHSEEMHVNISQLVEDVVGHMYDDTPMVDGQAPLKNGHKSCFLGYRKYIDIDHPYRLDADSFHGTIELGTEPTTYYDHPILDDIIALGNFKDSRTYKSGEYAERLSTASDQGLSGELDVEDQGGRVKLEKISRVHEETERDSNGRLIATACRPCSQEGDFATELPARIVPHPDVHNYQQLIRNTKIPMFDGRDYAYWKVRLEAYLLSQGSVIWDIVASQYTIPKTHHSIWEVKISSIEESASFDTLTCNELFSKLKSTEIA